MHETVGVPQGTFRHLQCVCLWQPELNKILCPTSPFPNPPESSKINKRRMGKPPNVVLGKSLPKLNFYYHCADYVCKRKQERKEKEKVSPRKCT